MPEKRILHIITDLTTGGAQEMLRKLIDAIDATNFHSEVLTLAEGGPLADEIEAVGVPVHCMSMKSILNSPIGLWRLARIVRRVNADVIQGWMYHGNLAALIARFLTNEKVPVIWNVRHSVYDLGREKRLTAFLIRLGAKLSRYPAAIIYNSGVSARQHEALGYRADRTKIIPNGFDTERFKPDPDARVALRKELGFNDETILVGLIARYHPMKDHATFIKAAAQIARQRENVGFVLVGKGVDENNQELMDRIHNAGISGEVRLLGERRDIPYIMAGLDILCSSSAWGESFPNVIGEAMSCGVPCVATNVGDSAAIIGDTGRVVSPRDSIALERELLTLIGIGAEKRRFQGERARNIIEQKFSRRIMTEQFAALLADLDNQAG